MGGWGEAERPDVEGLKEVGRGGWPPRVKDKQREIGSEKSIYIISSSLHIFTILPTFDMVLNSKHRAGTIASVY